MNVESHLQAAWAAGRMAADQIEQAEALMNAKPEPKLAEDFWIDNVLGGREHRALIFMDLQQAAEAVHAETEHDADMDPEVRAACALLKDYEFKV